MSENEIERGLVAQGVPREKARLAAQRAVIDGNPLAKPPAGVIHARKATAVPAILRGDSDVDELVIRAPMPPTLTNSAHGRSRQWYAVHGEKKRYWRQLDELQGAGFIERPPRRPIGRATVRSLMTLAGRMDDDNAVARHKWLVDWLATRGYLRSDRLLSWGGMPVQVVKRNEEPSIQLTITSLDARESL